MGQPNGLTKMYLRRRDQAQPKESAQQSTAANPPGQELPPPITYARAGVLKSLKLEMK